MKSKLEELASPTNYTTEKNTSKTKKEKYFHGEVKKKMGVVSRRNVSKDFSLINSAFTLRSGNACDKLQPLCRRSISSIWREKQI